ncbi:hypothetical protein [Frankia gtarii]|uniref:NHL domain-containing protein n=1 Tax=Frankia gtarii TaxID=2950102 RepID=UPI0021C2124F|nr:hypothetical protein [Frankia gtarii]
MPGAFRPGGFRPGGADAAAPVTPPPAVRPVRWQRRRRLAVTIAATAATMVLGLIAYLVIPGGSASSPRSGTTITAAVGDAGVTPPGPDGVAAINEFEDLAVDAAGDVYLADQADPRIRRIDRRGYVSTVAGSGETGTSGDGGPALQAAFQRPGSVAVDAAGNIYISDGSNRVRRVDTHGTVTTIVGTGDDADTGDGGPAIQAALHFAVTTGNISIDVAGNLYICVLDGLRRVDRAGIITTLIKGRTGFSPSPPGDGGPASAGRLKDASAVVADRSGDLYIADSEANRIRRIDSRGIVTTVAGTGAKGFSGDGGPATRAMLNNPTGVAVDRAGNLYIADSANHRIRRVTPDGIITAFAGSGTTFVWGSPKTDETNGPATSIVLWNPEQVAVDGAGNVYIGDSPRVLKVDPQGASRLLAKSS